MQARSGGGVDAETVAFKVMLRRGGRDDRTRTVQVEASVAIVRRHAP